ncbi:uncharacterized protein LOC143613821 [Bidens hawaiensis]|uniref:uncharacterized protein LOC143613821 n=1 Tax=Bidens hawaiensis TaxID=980011 RepID=UPI00404A6A8B
MNDSGTSSSSSNQLVPNVLWPVSPRAPPPPPPNLPRSDNNLLEAEKMSNASTGYDHAIPANTLDHHTHHQQQQTIILIPKQIVPPPPTLPTPNQPRFDLLEGHREDYIKVGVPLYNAGITGDWKAAKRIIDKRPDLLCFAITEKYETLLHIAASAENTKDVKAFVINLVNLMDKKDLELQNSDHNTALSFAATARNVETAKTMVDKNMGLIEIPNKDGMMPLYMATKFAKHKMVRYLYGKSKNMADDFWTDANRGWFLQKCVEVEIFGK